MLKKPPSREVALNVDPVGSWVAIIEAPASGSPFSLVIFPSMLDPVV